LQKRDKTDRGALTPRCPAPDPVAMLGLYRGPSVLDSESEISLQLNLIDAMDTDVMPAQLNSPDKASPHASTPRSPSTMSAVPRKNSNIKSNTASIPSPRSAFTLRGIQHIS